MSEKGTERPTQKRRDDARKQGQVARSTEIGSAMTLVAAAGALTAFGPGVFSGMQQVLREGFERAHDPGQAESGDLVTWALKAIALAAAPLVIPVLLTGLAMSVGQVGLRFTPKALKPSLSRMSPLKNLKNVFGKNGLVEAIKAIAKTAVIGLIAFFVIWPQIPELVLLVGMTPGAMIAHVAQIAMSLILRVGACFLVIAAADYAWQRYRHESGLKMTKEELKQELKQTDLSPQIRRQIRRRQMEQTRRRMLADVPTADVVIVNPTHYAVALRYDGSTPAPEVVAKGVDLIAAAIRRVAEEHQVPVAHNAPLARALYREVEIGQQIPEAFFAAVAEVLAFVFRTAGRGLRVGRGTRRA